MDKQKTASGSNTIAYCGSIIAISVVLACISLIRPITTYSHILTKLLVIVPYLVLGFYHLKRERIRYDGRIEDLSFTVKLSSGIFLVLFAFYFVFIGRRLFTPLASTASFILPTVIAYGFQIFSSIPSKEYKLWFPDPNFIANKAIVFVNSISLQFQVTIDIADTKFSVFQTVAPTQMSLGKTFQAFLIQQAHNNINIQLRTEDGREVGWRFFAKGFLGLTLTPLDPSLNLWENDIKRNSVIVAKRVMLNKVSNADRLERVTQSQF